MAEFDPLSTKVADVYDTSGRRIGSLRAPDYSAVGCLLALAAAVVAVVVVFWLVVAGGISTKNLIRHGEFTTDTVAAEVRDHKDDPNYFTERAKASKMKIIRERVVAEDNDDHDGLRANVRVIFSVENGSSEDHTFAFGKQDIVVEAVVDGRTRTLHLGGSCGESIRAADGGNGIRLPAGRIMGEFESPGLCKQPDVKYTKLTLIKGPSIEKIDRLPVSGGPPNTDWYGASEE